jgi:hypothetical protein
MAATRCATQNPVALYDNASSILIKQLGEDEFYPVSAHSAWVPGEAVRSWRRVKPDLVRRVAPRLIAYYGEYPEASSSSWTSHHKVAAANSARSGSREHSYTNHLEVSAHEYLCGSGCGSARG